MRLKSLIVAAVAVSAVGLAAPNPASAGGFHHHRGSGDPYAYVPEVPRYAKAGAGTAARGIWRTRSGAVTGVADDRAKIASW